MMVRRTVTTVLSLSVTAAAAWLSFRFDSPAPLYAMGVLALFASFLEARSFVPSPLPSRLLDFAACALAFWSITLLAGFSRHGGADFSLSGPSALVLLGSFLVLFLAVAAGWRGYNPREAGRRSGWSFVLFLYFGLLAAVTVRTLTAPSYVVLDPDRPFGSSAHLADAGVYFFLTLVLTSKFTDISAYLGGMLFGRKLFNGRKLAPRISPKKTLAGLLFGTAGSAFFGFAALWYNPFGTVHPLAAAAFGLTVGAASVGGDLLESEFKRAFGKKDSGRFLPGIGGWFDLTDSLFWAGPAGLFVLHLNALLTG